MNTIEKYLKAIDEDDEKEINRLGHILSERQRKKLYNECVRHLKNKTKLNHFEFCSHYAKTVVSNELDVLDESYEISSLDTKNGCPHVVYFE